MDFSHKLKELRKARGISQVELADALHVSRSAVAKWENGLGMPGKESLSILADYFGVSKGDLMADSKDESNKSKMSDRDKRIIARGAIISVSAFLALTIAGIFIEPIGDVIILYGLPLTLVILSISNIIRILRARKISRGEDNTDFEK